MHVGEEEKRKAVKKSFDVFDRDAAAAAAADCSCEGERLRSHQVKRLIQSRARAVHEPCTGAAAKIPSFRPELLQISLLWQRFPQRNKPRKQQILRRLLFFSDPQAQISLEVPPPSLLAVAAAAARWIQRALPLVCLASCERCSSLSAGSRDEVQH